MRDGQNPARDLELLDAVDALERLPFEGAVWRVVREGKDPIIASASHSRWCNAAFDVLYTSLERQGAIAEVHALLSLQPVFPSKPRWHCHELRVRATRTLKIADMAALDRLGVETARYRERQYGRTQAIADAAYFLDYDGLLVPSARWECQNLVLFAGKLDPTGVEVVDAAGSVIDWENWRTVSRNRRTPSR